MPTTTIHYTDVAAEAVRRGALPAFADRAFELARHCAVVSGHLNGDHVALGFTSMRVAKSWPLRGSITLVREDGVKFRLSLVRNRWTAKAVS